MKESRICLDARLNQGVHGGVEQFIVGLAYGLSNLTDSAESYFFLVDSEDASNWLAPYLKGKCRLVMAGPNQKPSKWKKRIAAVGDFLQNPLPTIRSIGKPRAVKIPVSDGTIEKLDIDLMHFTMQKAFLTQIPSIYHPHDLQHIHLPEFFTARLRLVRETRYRLFCEQAKMVAVGSTWIRNDVISNYNLNPEKVSVIPLAPPVSAYPKPSIQDLEDAREKFLLPKKFVFYPAKTWPHKNHTALIEAAATLRDSHNIKVSFVFSGQKSDHFVQLKNKIEALGLEKQMQFVGYVSPMELQCLYKLCHCVVIPSNFEAGSFPLFEAFYAQVPAAVSNVTSLPKQASDAALIFNPDDISEIAGCIQKLWVDDRLCKELVAKGNERIKDFSWEKTAKLFRAHYRRILNIELSDEEIELLNQEPIM